MIHGEFDFEEESHKPNSDEDKWIFWSGQFLFVLFGSVVTLVLIDVFLGYTVSDIKVRLNEFYISCKYFKTKIVYFGRT